MEKYFLNGKQHRENGPAIISYYKNGELNGEWYFFNDKQHREDGSALIHYYKDGKIMRKEYWLMGELISESSEEFAKALKKHQMIEIYE